MEACVKVLVRVHISVSARMLTAQIGKLVLGKKRCAAQQMYVELHFAVYSVTENYFIKYLSRLTI